MNSIQYEIVEETTNEIESRAAEMLLSLNQSHNTLENDIVDLNKEVDTQVKPTYMGFDDGIVNQFLFDFNEHLEEMTVKQLQHILRYYGIRASGGKKKNYINRILSYESNVKHYQKVCKRKRLWQNLSEMINDEYLSQYISF